MTFPLRRDVKGMTPVVLLVLDPLRSVQVLRADMTRDARDVETFV